jgi:hypothetical protein
MKHKKEIEKLLQDLKDVGWGRKEIEAEFEYNPNYISQALSRGGNEKLLNNLKKLHGRVKDDEPTEEIITIDRTYIIEALCRNVLLQIAKDRAERNGEPENWQKYSAQIDADTVEEMNKIASRLGLPRN